MNKKLIQFTDHPTITSVTHIYSGRKTLEEVLEDIIVNHINTVQKA